MSQLLLFTGSNCPACEVVKKDLQEEISLGKIIVKNLDDEDTAKEAAQYNIFSKPTLIEFKNNIPNQSFVGSSIGDKLRKSNLI